MILTVAMAALPAVRPFSSLLAALSVLFGADTEQLEEDAVLRLVEQARAGDRAARQRLYRQHVQRVFRTVRGMLRSDAEAEDVTQDAMLTALTSLTATGELPDVAGTGSELGDDIDLARQRAALLRALAELTPREREIVSLRYGSDLNASEIAAQFGMEAANVRKILERVRIRLGERIDAIVNTRGAAA
jgi:DNA-directed RNA polymerase specialized sigma24 family protein